MKQIFDKQTVIKTVYDLSVSIVFSQHIVAKLTKAEATIYHCISKKFIFMTQLLFIEIANSITENLKPYTSKFRENF